MKDSSILGTGNSRYLKSAIPAGTSWESALAMLIAGTFPIDLNGINEAGFAQVGDALGKKNLLKDATAALFGLNSDAVPDDVLKAAAQRLGVLDSAVFDRAATYIWNKYSVAPALGSNLGETKILGGSYESAESMFYYSDSVIVNADGDLEMVNPSTVMLSYSKASNASVLLGKYIINEYDPSSSLNLDGIHYVPANATYSQDYESIYGYGVKLSALHKVLVEKTRDGSVSATTSDAYPTAGMQNGFYYEYVASEKVIPEVEIISYVGTGDAAKTISWSFTPQLFWVFARKASGAAYTSPTHGSHSHPVAWGTPQALIADTSTAAVTSFAYDGNDVTMSATNGGNALNGSGTTYYCFAIG